VAFLRPWRFVPADAAVLYAPQLMASGFVPNLAFNGLNLVPPIVVNAGATVAGAAIDLGGYRNFVIYVSASAINLQLQWQPFDPGAPASLLGLPSTLSANVGIVFPAPGILFGNSVAANNLPYSIGRLSLFNGTGAAITLQNMSGLLCSSL
jgi:hypothetical protein